MSDLRKIETFDGLSGKQFNSEPGRHAGVWVMGRGTNSGATEAGLEHLGDIVITRNGKQRVNVNAKKIGDIDDIREGKYLLNSTGSGDYEAAVFIPFAEKGLPNALNITDESELNIRQIPNPNASGVLSDLEIEVQAQLTGIEERYNYNILSLNQSFASSVSSKAISFNQKNITSIYIEDVDDVVSLLQYESNGQIKISSNDLIALQAYTNHNNRIEDKTFDVVEIENFTPGNPGSTSNQGNILRLTTTGAGSVDITHCSIDWPV